MIRKSRKYLTVDDFESEIISYFEEIDKQNKEYQEVLKKPTAVCRVPNMESLALWMGFAGRTALWEYGAYVDLYGKSYSNAIKSAASAIASYKLEGAQTGRLKELTVILDLNVNHGYKQEQTVTHKNLYGEMDDSDLNALREKLTADYHKQLQAAEMSKAIDIEPSEAP
jgi:hypothetical protein